jgi:hypothetical protein
MFYNVHYSIITKKNQQNTQKIYIYIFFFSQFVATTCFGTYQNVCSYYNHYKHTHLTRDLIYISFYIVLQDILNIYTQLLTLFNLNFNYPNTTRCLDFGQYIYKQLHLGRMHTSLYYLPYNSAPWWWPTTTETCSYYKLRKCISFVHFVGFPLAKR